MGVYKKSILFSEFCGSDGWTHDFFFFLDVVGLGFDGLGGKHFLVQFYLV